MERMSSRKGTSSHRPYTVAEELNRQANVMLSKYCALAEEIFADVRANF